MAFKKRPPRTARNTMMDLLARRDHSEKELRQKLKLREFPAEEIDKALQYAHDHNWLGDTTKLAHTMAGFLHRRGKGIHKINNTLREKGLPAVASDDALELEKAMALIKTKRKTKKYSDLKDPKVRASLGRFLQSRGFPLEIIRKVLFGLRVET